MECSPWLLPVHNLLRLGDDSALLPTDEDDGLFYLPSGNPGVIEKNRKLMLSTKMPLTVQTLMCADMHVQKKQESWVEVTNTVSIPLSVHLSLLPFTRDELCACSSLGTTHVKMY